VNKAIGRVVREGDDLAVRPGSATLRLHPGGGRRAPGPGRMVDPETGNAIRD
jgi:hypothetical protein